MRCPKCGNDARKKLRDAAGGRCPNCEYRFVTDPSKDGLTDMMVKHAEDVVSGNGTYCFLPKQLEYQLYRAYQRKQRYSFVPAVSHILCIVTLILGASVSPFFFLFSVISLIAFVVTFNSSSSQTLSLSRLHKVVQKWTAANPHAKLISNKQHQFNSDNSHLEEVSFDRVLVCDKNETVNFFLENLFHFHYSCPVLGGNGYPDSMYRDMLRRLKGNPNLKVFLLHDYSPKGSEFVHKMTTDHNWFGDREYQIVDLGLNANQKEALFKFMTIGEAANETAEVALFSPATLIQLCGAAINDEVPLDQVQPAAVMNDHSGSGGYG